MKICYYPLYDISGGSSRCRAYFIQQKLLEWGIDAYLRSAPYSADIIVFQKTYGKSYVDIARKARTKGIKIVFDLDDDYQCAEMIKLADVVVCDSLGLVQFAQNQVSKKIDGRVILNPVDYIKEPLPRRIHTKTENLDLVYFAGPFNFRAFKNCKTALRRLKKDGQEYSFTILGGQNLRQILSYAGKTFEGFDFFYTPWRYETFSKEIQKFDLVVEPQAWDWKGPCKIVDAVTHNLPGIFEDIPPNRRLAKKIGITKFLAKTDEEWYEGIKKLYDPEVRNAFLKKAIPRVWKICSIDKITKDWLDLFEELLK